MGCSCQNLAGDVGGEVGVAKRKTCDLPTVVLILLLGTA